jgi:hypothetical protein
MKTLTPHPEMTRDNAVSRGFESANPGKGTVKYMAERATKWSHEDMWILEPKTRQRGVV